MNLTIETMIEELNKDQLDGLSKLCFDLAKGSFALILLPVQKLHDNPLNEITKMAIGLLIGLAFTSAALILLKLKEKIKK